MVKRWWWSLPSVILVGASWAVPRVVSQAQTVPALVKAVPAQMLVNGQGMTLYLFTPDKKNKSVCYGDCAEYWPPALVGAGQTVPAHMPGLSGVFGVTRRTDGKRQLTYDGAPLYTFLKDKKPGEMEGQGVEGIWWVVVVNATSHASSTTDDGHERHGGGTPTPHGTPTVTSSYYSGGHGRHGGDG